MLSFSIIILLSIVLLCSSFQRMNMILRKYTSRNSMNMIFGKTTTSKNTKIVIKVDGKTIDTDQKSVNLRRILIDNNIEVYPIKAKILGNCGGAGICGTCAVKVIDGAENFNPPSKNELKTLNGKSADIRLSCCSKISGPITIKTKP